MGVHVTVLGFGLSVSEGHEDADHAGFCTWDVSPGYVAFLSSLVLRVKISSVTG